MADESEPEVEVLPPEEPEDGYRGFRYLQQWAAGKHDDVRIEDVHRVYREHVARVTVMSGLGVAARMSRVQGLLDQVDEVEAELSARISNLSNQELLRLRDARSADLYRNLTKMTPDASKLDNVTGQSGILGGALAGVTEEVGTAERPLSPEQREKLIHLGGKVRKGLVALAVKTQDPVEEEADA